MTSKELKGRRVRLLSDHCSLVTCHFLKYPSRLKALSVAFFAATTALLLLEGCADPLERPMVQEAGEKFQRGITGNGSLQAPDRSEDPTIGGYHP